MMVFINTRLLNHWKNLQRKAKCKYTIVFPNPPKNHYTTKVFVVLFKRKSVRRKGKKAIFKKLLSRRSIFSAGGDGSYRIILIAASDVKMVALAATSLWRRHR